MGANSNGFDHPLIATRRIARNTIFLSIADIANKVIMFVFYLFAARHLGVEEFGVLSFAIAFVTMWSVFADLGLGIVSSRELARDLVKGRGQVNSALAIKLVATGLVILLIILMVNLLGFEPRKVHLVYICTIFVLEAAFTTYFASVFQGLEKMHLTTLSRILQGVVLLTGVFVLIRTSARAEGYAWLYVIAGFVSVLFAGIAAYRAVRPVPDFSFRRWHGLLKESLPLGLAVIFVSFYYWNGTTLLSKWSGDRAVGAYSAAFRIVAGSIFLALSFSASVYPFFSRLYVSDQARLKEVLVRALRYMAIIALPLGVFGMILAQPIILLVYGQKYIVAITPLRLLVWWSVCACFSSLISNYLIAINRASAMTIQSALSLGINLLGNLLFIPRLGAVGAALSIVIAEFAGVVYLFYRQLATPTRVTVRGAGLIALRVGGALALGAVVMVFLARWNRWAAAVAGVGLYFLSLFFTGALSRDDLKFLSGLVMKKG